MTSWNLSFILLLLLLVIPLERLAKRWHYPVDAVLFAAGMLASAMFIYLLHSDTGLRWDNMKPVIMNFFLPAMVFKATMKLPLRVARQCVGSIVWLALPLGIISAVLIATVMYHAIGHSTGFPWLTALVAGTLLAAVDPGPVLTMHSAKLVPERLHVLLHGESLLKDVTTILLFSVLLTLPEDSGTFNSRLPLLFTQRFIEAAGIGIAAGIVCGYLGSKAVQKLRDDPGGLLLASILAAYSGFMLADNFSGSGITAVLVTGLSLRLLPRGSGGLTSIAAWQLGNESWTFLARMLERLMFMLGGATMSIAMFSDHWRTMLYAVATVITIRAVLLLLSWLPLRAWGNSNATTMPWQHAGYIFLGGGCGMVTLCLVLALPLALTGWYTVQSAAYGVVIFHLFVQAPVISWLSRRGVFKAAGHGGNNR